MVNKKNLVKFTKELFNSRKRRIIGHCNFLRCLDSLDELLGLQPIPELLLDIVQLGIYNIIVLRIKEPIEFIWDRGNIDKNWKKHQVTNQECEEVFFDENKRISKDVLHSEKEKRYILLGKTKKDRLLFVILTLRNKKVRIISARNVNRKEVKLYEKTT